MVEIYLSTKLDRNLYSRLMRLSNSPTKFAISGVPWKSDNYPNGHVQSYQSGI